MVHKRGMRSGDLWDLQKKCPPELLFLLLKALDSEGRRYRAVAWVMIQLPPELRRSKRHCRRAFCVPPPTF